MKCINPAYFISARCLFIFSGLQYFTSYMFQFLSLFQFYSSFLGAPFTCLSHLVRTDHPRYLMIFWFSDSSFLLSSSFLLLFFFFPGGSVMQSIHPSFSISHFCLFSISHFAFAFDFFLSIRLATFLVTFFCPSIIPLLRLLADWLIAVRDVRCCAGISQLYVECRGVNFVEDIKIYCGINLVHKLCLSFLRTQPALHSTNTLEEFSPCYVDWCCVAAWSL